MQDDQGRRKVKFPANSLTVFKIVPILAALVLALTLVASPRTAAAQNIELGKHVFQTKIGCPLCHGWAANGFPEDPRAPGGANLRETAMDRDTLMTVFKCGLPGTSMPFFDQYSYTDDRCYGMTAAQMGDAMPPAGSPNLIKREVEALADYLLAKVVGRGEPTFEECVEFFGTPVARCNDFPGAPANGAGSALAPAPAAEVH